MSCVLAPPPSAPNQKSSLCHSWFLRPRPLLAAAAAIPTEHQWSPSVVARFHESRMQCVTWFRSLCLSLSPIRVCLFPLVSEYFVHFNCISFVIQLWDVAMDGAHWTGSGDGRWMSMPLRGWMMEIKLRRKLEGVSTWSTIHSAFRPRLHQTLSPCNLRTQWIAVSVYLQDYCWFTRSIDYDTTPLFLSVE